MLISTGLFIWLAVRRIVSEISVLGSPWFQISIMMFILGFLAVLLGLIAEVVIRTYYESQDKKTYTVKQVIEPEKKRRKCAKSPSLRFRHQQINFLTLKGSHDFVMFQQRNYNTCNPCVVFFIKGSCSILYFG